jgi:membrane protease YdiL (CAAX protease family)
MSPGWSLRVGVYLVLYILTARVLAPLLIWLGGYLAGVTWSQLASALAANWIALRIFGKQRLRDVGLAWDAAAIRNLGLGLLGGAASAALVLLPPLALQAARLVPAPESQARWDIFLFTALSLLAGAAGEEILFRGYGFQILLQVWGPYTTICTVAALFGALHAMNPNATWLSMLNTSGFGALFGYAFLRSRDLWLPIGLHYGWNFTLPLFGVNLSGLTMKLTGHAIVWNVSSTWSGGDYGPEGSVLTSIVLAPLAIYLWKAPVRVRPSEVIPCEPGSPSPSS